MTKINHITTADVEAFEMFPELNMYQQVAGKSAIYPGQGSFLGLMYVNAKLNGEAGEFSENVGKALRDDDVLVVVEPDDIPDHGIFGFNNLTEERRQKLILELGDILWYAAAAAKELGVSLEHVARRNLQKLQDRSARDKLQGSGDDR